MNYVLYGEEQFRLQKALETILTNLHLDIADMNVISYDALHTDFSAILEDAMTIPFFADRKVILVYHANFLSSSNDTGMDPKALEEYLKHPVAFTTLVLMGDFAKLDARKGVVKKIKNAKKDWQVLEFRKLDELGKQSCIDEQIAKRHIHIRSDARLELNKRLPLDMGVIDQEMEKLELYQDEITLDVVKTLVSRPLEEDVFQLVNAVVEKNIHKAFCIWQDLCVTNTEPIYLIALLAGQFRFLFEVKALMIKGATKEEIAKQLQAHPYRVKLSMQSADRLTLPYLMEMLEKLATLDQQLKSGMIDKKMGFEMFLLELSKE